MAQKESCPVEGLKKILLATDGSEYCEGAVREALRLSQRCGSTLYAVSVAQVGLGLLTHAPDIVEALEKEANKALDDVRARADSEGVPFEAHFHHGEEPYEYIIKDAASLGVDLILIGRRGRRGLAKLLMGSSTALVIGNCNINVMVVPRAAEVEFKSILLATDGSDFSRKAATEAISIAKTTGASLSVLSVTRASGGQKALQSARENAEAAKAMAESEGVGAKALAETGTPYNVIVDKSAEIGCDLIVVGCHGATGLEKLLMGSVAERVIGLATCAVLVAK